MIKTKLVFATLTVLLAFSSVGIVNQVNGLNSQTNLGEIGINAVAPGGKPMFVSISPEQPTYGYPNQTVVNVTYMVLAGDVPELMGSFNGWSSPMSMSMTSSNVTHEWWSREFTLNASIEFKARNNADWGLGEDAPNHALLVEGALGAPDLYDVIGGTYLGPNVAQSRYFVPEGTTVTIVASVLNGNNNTVLNVTGDYYLVGDMNGWNISDRTYQMTFSYAEFPTSGTNITYWEVNYTMTATTVSFKIGGFGDWPTSEGGGFENNVLTPFNVRLSKPVLMGVDGATEVQVRDESTNSPGKYRAALGDEVRIWYSVFTLDDCSDQGCQDSLAAVVAGGVMELQGDDGGNMLDWDVNQQVPFTYNNTVLMNLTNYANITDGAYIGQANYTNAAVATFWVNYTLAVETTQFKGNFDGDWEGFDFSANNVLLAGMDWSSSLTTDIWNVGTFNLTFSATFADLDAAQTDTVGYGIWTGESWTEYNYTGSIPNVSTDGTWEFDMVLDAADHGIVAGLDGNMKVILYHFDKGLNKTVKIYEGSQSDFNAKDGVPVPTLTADAVYSSKDVSVSYSASPADSEFDKVTIDWGDGNTDTLNTNSTISSSVTHTYAADGEYTVVLHTWTKAGGHALQSATIVVDTTAPTATLAAPATADDLVVQFNFTTADTGSGVQSTTLDYGDGSTPDDVTGTVTKLHSYSAEGTYTAKLTVVDNAGNSFSVTVTVTITLPTSSTSTSETTSETTSTSTSTSESTSETTPGFTFAVLFLGMISLGFTLKYYRRRR